MVTDAGTKLGACVAGHGIAQVIDIGLEPYFANGQLEVLFSDWPDETFPLYVYYPSRHHVPRKVRAFIDFIAATCRPSAPSTRLAAEHPHHAHPAPRAVGQRDG
jgi:DNA-binding transcriptional LysR family regulator